MDKLNPKIIAGVVVVLLVVAAVLMYVFIPRASAPAPAPAPSEDDTPLKPLKSATVLATKTGGGGGVSGYSFQREYAEGECTFTTAMNKYVTLTATLGIDTEDPRLPFVDKVKAIWKTGSIEMSVVEVTLNPANQSLVLLIPATTKTDINIACDGSVTARTDNTIEILYSTKSLSGFAPPPKLWGTIRMVQGLGTEITSAFDSIPVGKGTELAVTLVAAGVGDVTTTQSIPYKFTVKGTSPPQVINPIYLQVVNTNTYIMTVGTASVTVKTRKKVLSSYADYVALQVVSDSRDENIGDYISIQPSGTITYKRDPPDDSCFFKIEMASQDCEYVWQQHVPTTCSTECGPGFYMEKATGVLKQPTGDGAACRNLAEVPLRPGQLQCTSQPECPVDCILGTAPAGTVQLYEDITNTNTATCTAQGTISQMKVLIPSAGTGIKCAAVYSSTPDKAPVTITGVSSPALTCTSTIKSTSGSTSITAGVDILQGTVSSVVWPAGASGSRLEGINFNSTSDVASRTCTLKLWPEGASAAITIASISVPRVAVGTGRLCKVMLTNKGVLRFYTKSNLNTVSIWDEQSPIIFGTEGVTGVYTFRMVNYVIPGTTTPITKLEIVASGGVIKATYPSW
jgi:hypothetical protein